MAEQHSEPLSSETKSVLRPVFDRLGRVLEENITTLLDENVSVQSQEFYRVEDGRFPESFPEDLLLYEGSVEEELEGTMYKLLPVTSAVTLSGIILKTPDQQLEKQRRLGRLTDAARDGADELANQVFGFWGQGVRNHLERQISITRTGSSRISLTAGRTQLDEITENKCLGILYNIQLAEHDACPFLLIIPVDLTEQFLEPVAEDVDVSSLFLPWKTEESDRDQTDVVLVVDEEGEDRDELTSLLEANGYRTKTSSTGRQTLEVLNEDEVDALITEIRIDGFGLLKNVQKVKKTSDLPILICSESRSKETIVKTVKKLGASGYVAKPFDADDVLEKVATAVGT